jgi:hypothetical protein
MSYIAKIALQNGREVYLREPGQPQMVEDDLGNGVTLITHSGLPKLLEMKSAEEFQALCIQHNIHAKICEVEDAEIITEQQVERKEDVIQS